MASETVEQQMPTAERIALLQTLIERRRTLVTQAFGFVTASCGILSMDLEHGDEERLRRSVRVLIAEIAERDQEWYQLKSEMDALSPQ